MNQASKGNEKVRDHCLQENAFFLSEARAGIGLTAVDEYLESGLHGSVHFFGMAHKSQGSHLMAPAAGGTSGDMDSWKQSVAKTFLPYPIDAGVQKALGIPQSMLADGGADAADAGLKQRFCPVFRGF